MADPRRIVVAGDWQGHLADAQDIIDDLPRLLPGEPTRLVLQLGDFGWYLRRGNLRPLSESLDAAGAVLWWVEGNHDDYPGLAADLPTAPGGEREVADRIWHLPRGHRWTWHGRTWLALGGAVSVDRARRVKKGIPWFPEEEVTAEQAAAVSLAGPADVVVAHDCPAGVPLGLPPINRRWGWAPEDIARSERHRVLLAEVCAYVRPRHWLHGHYNVAHHAYAQLAGDGELTHVAGFSDHGTPGNYGVLNVETMMWEPKE